MSGRRATMLGAAALAATPARAAATLEEAHRRFAALPGSASYLVHAEDPRGAWSSSLEPDRQLFVGSAVKSFILAAYLRAVEQGRLTLDEQLGVNDEVRSLVSPVLGNLTGTTTARSVLEAMISHSDNTATDIAIGRVGPAPVRALIAEAGLRQTRIPDSTRRLFSWLAGAPAGVDLGWAELRAVAAGAPSQRTPRPAVNEGESMLSTATELVAWYRAALAGRFFARPETLVEFKRVSAMADALALIVPDGIAAYGKGGSIEWEGFHCLCAPGQMVVRGVPVSFCFTVNWNGASESIGPMTQSLLVACTAMLKAARDRVVG